jgi:hypothetical protein
MMLVYILELVKINKIVHYNVVRRLGQEANNDNKLEVGMICDGLVNDFIDFN